MNYREKELIIQKCKEKEMLSVEDFKELQKLSMDREICIRSSVAELLYEYNDRESQNILLRLCKDREWLVRADAYDSLSYFYCKAVETFLRSSVKKEKNEIVRSYIISAWADVVVGLGDIQENYIQFLISQKKKQKDSSRCLLSCCYAEQKLKLTKEIDEIISFLNDCNYQIRCTALNTLLDIVNEENITEIKMAILDVLKRNHECIAVHENAANILKKLEEQEF